MTAAPLLEARAVSKTFEVGDHTVRALDDVSLAVGEGSCHAIVGESGSGKSTFGALVLGQYLASSGAIRFQGETLPARRTKPLKRAIQLVQQNPMSALNRRRRIVDSLLLPLQVHGLGVAPGDRRRVIDEVLEEVGIDPDLASRSPAALSGGQRQRVAIARAVICQPKLIVLDEPTSALDVLVQARVLTLLDRLRRSHGLTYVFITHDLGVVRNVADTVSVFQAGRLVETGPVAAIFNRPKTAYTATLLSSIPVVNDTEAEIRARYAALAGDAAARSADP